ncbi:MAG: hypothetical protein V7696_12405 [Halioglobus sp.]
MKHMVKQFFGVLVLMSVGLSAQAGHLFTQASLNTPINLTAGFGIDLPQLATWEETSSSGNSNFNVENFDSGDIMRVDIGGVIRVFAFDSMPSGWTATSNRITSSPNDPGYAALAITPPITWRIDAVAGAFTLEGFRLYTVNGTVDGTNTNTINQSAVTVSSFSSTPVPVFGPIHMVLLILGLIGVAGIRQRRKASQH